MRIIFVFLVLTGVLLGFGEKPKQVVSTENTGTVVQPKIEATSEAQFARGYRALMDASQINYPTYAEKAVEDFNNYLKVYPKEKERLDVLFWLNRTYAFLGNDAAQEAALDQYYAEAPTSNKLYKNAELDRASVLARKGQYQLAADKFQALTDEFAGVDVNWQRELNKRSLATYEALDNKQQMAKIYKYFIDTKDKLENQNLYAVYVYKYAVVKYDLGEKIEAKKYFKEVVAITAKKDALSESAQSYLEKL